MKLKFFLFLFYSPVTVVLFFYCFSHDIRDIQYGAICLSPSLEPIHFQATEVCSIWTDLQLPFQPLSITTHWSVPNYAACRLVQSRYITASWLGVISATSWLIFCKSIAQPFAPLGHTRISDTVHCICTTGRQVRDSVQWIYSEPMLVYYVQLFRDAYWPDGQLAAAAEPPTELQKLQMRRLAKSTLLRNIPGLYCDMCGVGFW